MYCLYMRDFWEEAGKDFEGLDMEEEYDADDHAEVHKQYNIKDIPTVILVDEDGKEIVRIEGAKEKEEIKNIIKTLKH